MKTNQIIKWIILLILIVTFGYILKLRIDSFRLESNGKISVATMIGTDPYFKGGPDIKYTYKVENQEFNSYDKLRNENDRKLKTGDRFFIIYLPDNKSFTKILRDKNNNILLFRDSLQLDSIKREKK